MLTQLYKPLFLVMVLIGVLFIRKISPWEPETLPLVNAPIPLNIGSIDTVKIANASNPFYKKALNASGIQILSSSRVSNDALIKAKKIVLVMLARIPEVKPILIKKNVRIVIIATTELLTDIPEYRNLYNLYPGTDWNKRARGLGPTDLIPITSCGEENLICSSRDPYIGENILVHEFAHAIMYALDYKSPDFSRNLKRAYNNAQSEGLWERTYAMTNPGEYFAEGVQCWYNANIGITPANGIHNEINTREELKEYDLLLYNLISQYFYADTAGINCE